MNTKLQINEINKIMSAIMRFLVQRILLQTDKRLHRGLTHSTLIQYEIYAVYRSLMQIFRL